MLIATKYLNVYVVAGHNIRVGFDLIESVLCGTEHYRSEH